MNPWPDWQDLGIPKDFASPRLLYNAPSRTLVLEVKPNNDGRAPTTLILLRGIEEKVYVQLGNIAPEMSCDDMVVAECQPTAYFNGLVLKANREGWGGDWGGIYRIDLAERRAELAFGPKHLSIPDSEWRGPGPQGPWISHLHSVSANAATIIATVGVPNGYEMHYRICTIDVASKALAMITDLPGTFF